MIRKCKFCQAAMPKDPLLRMCPSCKQVNFDGSMVDASKPEVLRMSEVSKQQKERRPRIPVGIFGDPHGQIGDEDYRPGLFGYDHVSASWGMPDTAVIMIGGPPGAGKTTLFLMLSEMVLDYYRDSKDSVLYISNEQSDEDLEGYGARLKLQNWDRILLYNAMGEGLRRPLNAIVDDYKPRLMVLDSLSNLLQTHGMTADQGIEVVNGIKDLSVKHRMTSLIVNQVNKEGEHRGLMDVLHKGDILLNIDKDDVTAQRQLYSTKNRYGQAPVELRMRMQDEGEERPGWLVPWED
jgi:predicted ATP-dependent serine protease